MPFTENDYELSLVELFQKLGYNYIPGMETDHDYNSPLFDEELEAAIKRINPKLTEAAIQDAMYKLTNYENGTLEHKNQVFMDYLQNGLPVSFSYYGETRSDICYLVDYNNIENNTFTIASQWTYIENSTKRPDLLVFINGLPLVVIELKSPSRSETDASEGYRQLKNYMHEIPTMFIYNAFCVMSDMTTTKAGTITSDEERFMEWKTKDGSYDNIKYAQFDTFFEGMFEKNRLLDIIKNFICFSNEGTKVIKILAGYHQYFAVKKAIESSKKASETNGKGGVFWHTQGSGKSLSMVFFSHLLQTALSSPTIVVITDRNDLDNQLYTQFAKCKDFLRQEPIQAESREHLKLLLNNRQVNGILFTTMQKFIETFGTLSERRNIVVMADEAHRGQYGLIEKVRVKKDDQGNEFAERVVGIARVIRNSLPNATYVGFTGTPISLKDRSTREVFGDYIDIYDMTQSVEDGATKPIYYESRVIKLKLDEETLKKIDKQYEIMAQNADQEVIEKSKRELSNMESILGNEKTIESLVEDIILHYENFREHLLTGKAMIVAYSRAIAMKIYKEIKKQRPEWISSGKVAAVMTSTNNDPEDWREVIGNETYKKEMAVKFKDNESELKIAIVVDMWLTGFDVPSLATMYVYKPMEGYNLMQAIARVNRVYQDKEGGLIVDYVGIAAALKQAMNDYTVRDRKNYGDQDITKQALPKFEEYLSICRDMIHGFDYSLFFTGNGLTSAKIITDAINYVMRVMPATAYQSSEEATNQYRFDFCKYTLMLKQSLSLCASIVKERDRIEASFFEAVRVAINRIIYGGTGKKFSLSEINEKINDLLKASVKSDGVQSLFTDSNKEVSIFDPMVLEEISKMKQKNLSVELLKRLIAEQVRIFRKTNVVKSDKFSELMQTVMNKYLSGLLTNEVVIQELLKIAEEISKGYKSGDDLGLTVEELAFYDALTKPQAIKDFYENNQLIQITKELTDELRKNKTVDFQKRESARARMKMIVKRLLKKYNYPPEGMEDAVKTVMCQCELWADNLEY